MRPPLDSAILLKFGHAWKIVSRCFIRQAIREIVRDLPFYLLTVWPVNEQNLCIHEFRLQVIVHLRFLPLWTRNWTVWKNEGMNSTRVRCAPSKSNIRCEHDLYLRSRLWATKYIKRNKRFLKFRSGDKRLLYLPGHWTFLDTINVLFNEPRRLVSLL